MRFECSTHDRIQMGDHLIIVGKVEAFHDAGGPESGLEALTFFRGRYGAASEPTE